MISKKIIVESTSITNIVEKIELIKNNILIQKNEFKMVIKKSYISFEEK